MATSLLQLSLAIAPALLVAGLIKHTKLPWERKKNPSERAELLSLLARDLRLMQKVFAHCLATMNVSASCKLPAVRLRNWKHLKHDPRLVKYSDEKIFKDMIKEFRAYEKLASR